MRLAKYLANAGVTSRRRAEILIAEGRVKVNGEPALLPQTLVDTDDTVEVDGIIVGGLEEKAYYLLNKPSGYISTAHDTHNRPKVTDLLKSTKARVYPVGRLDADTSGVLLLTNDGELAFRLTHPSYGIKKVYRAWVRGLPERGTMKKMSDGMIIEGKKTSPSWVRLVKTEYKKRSALLEITLTEGKKHQVKNMCSAAGHPVLKLHRESFAGLKADKLPEGSFRRLNNDEISMLYRLVGL